MIFKIEADSAVPVYKQLLNSFEEQLKNQQLSNGDMLPSMNVLSQQLGISKETVKKAYTILREMNYVESSHGKGFYVNVTKNINQKVLVIFDKLSAYKLLTYQALKESLGNSADINIILHEQDIELFAQMVDTNLNNYDFFIISANFKLEKPIQDKLVQVLKRIPNRKLLLLDKLVNQLPGNFGAIYQDFENDAYDALSEKAKLITRYEKVNVICSPNSLYYMLISKGIQKFCKEHQLSFSNFTNFDAENIQPNEIYVVLNRQLDEELFSILKMVKQKNYKLGEDIGVISYNESPINEFILDGLTVLSTDFTEMGLLAGNMIKEKSLRKIRNKFELIVRKTL